MKAKELIKKPREIEEIYQQIENDNKNGFYKSFIPHWINISDEVKLALMKDGFKVYEGEWMRGDYGLIIEW